MATVTILDCGHPPPPTSGMDTGCGKDRDGRTYCYVCCEARDRASLAEHGDGAAYLSGDGRTVTGWPGYVLGHVTREYQTREGFGGRTTRVYARIDGRTYSGRGTGRGMLIRLRALKAK
jgi:hypothetical protein